MIWSQSFSASNGLVEARQDIWFLDGLAKDLDEHLIGSHIRIMESMTPRSTLHQSFGIKYKITTSGHLGVLNSIGASTSSLLRHGVIARASAADIIMVRRHHELFVLLLRPNQSGNLPSCANRSFLHQVVYLSRYMKVDFLHHWPDKTKCSPLWDPPQKPHDPQTVTRYSLKCSCLTLFHWFPRDYIIFTAKWKGLPLEYI